MSTGCLGIHIAAGRLRLDELRELAKSSAATLGMILDESRLCRSGRCDRKLGQAHW